MPKRETKKCTEAEKLTRVHEAKGMLLDGASRADMLRHGADQWGLNTRQVENYVAEARAMMLDELQDQSMADTRWHVAARMRLYAKALKGKPSEHGLQPDFSTALRALDSLAKLQGYMMTDSERARQQTDLAAMTPEKQAEMIEEAVSVLGGNVNWPEGHPAKRLEN